MKKVYQTVHTDLETGIIGNCIQACLASLLEVPLDSLPFFCRMDLYKSHLREKHALHVLRFKGYPPRDGKHYIVGYDVKGVKEIGHCVIWRNGRIVHDPKRPKTHRLTKPHDYYQFVAASKVEEEETVHSILFGDSSDDQACSPLRSDRLTM